MNRKKVVKDKCANYKDGMCLVRDIECPLVTAFEYRGHKFPTEEAECSYFAKCVLGISEEEVTGEAVIKKMRYSYKPCKRCEKHFRPTSRGNKYCSDFCRKHARKQTHQEYDNKRK